jgi:hypothetical protein
VKIGPWGAAGGTPCDINMYSTPRRITSIRIWNDDTAGGYIKGFSFTYTDHTGASITVNIGGCSSSCRGAHENGRTIGAAWSTRCYGGSLKTVLSHTLSLSLPLSPSLSLSLSLCVCVSNCMNKLCTDKCKI